MRSLILQRRANDVKVGKILLEASRNEKKYVANDLSKRVGQIVNQMTLTKPYNNLEVNLEQQYVDELTETIQNILRDVYKNVAFIQRGREKEYTHASKGELVRYLNNKLSLPSYNKNQYLTAFRDKLIERGTAKMKFYQVARLAKFGVADVINIINPDAGKQSVFLNLKDVYDYVNEKKQDVEQSQMEKFVAKYGDRIVRVIFNGARDGVPFEDLKNEIENIEALRSDVPPPRSEKGSGMRGGQLGQLTQPIQQLPQVIKPLNEDTADERDDVVKQAELRDFARRISLLIDKRLADYTEQPSVEPIFEDERDEAIVPPDNKPQVVYDKDKQYFTLTEAQQQQQLAQAQQLFGSTVNVPIVNTPTVNAVPPVVPAVNPPPVVPAVNPPPVVPAVNPPSVVPSTDLPSVAPPSVAPPAVAPPKVDLDVLPNRASNPPKNGDKMMTQELASVSSVHMEWANKLLNLYNTLKSVSLKNSGFVQYNGSNIDNVLTGLYNVALPANARKKNYVFLIEDRSSPSVENLERANFGGLSATTTDGRVIKYADYGIDYVDDVMMTHGAYFMSPTEVRFDNGQYVNKNKPNSQAVLAQEKGVLVMDDRIAFKFLLDGEFKGLVGGGYMGEGKKEYKNTPDAIKKLEVIMGSIMAGNNNEKLIKDAKMLVQQLYKDRDLTKKEYNLINEELNNL